MLMLYVPISCRGLLGLLCNGCSSDEAIVGCEDYQRDSSGRIVDISKSKEINARWLTRNMASAESKSTLRLPPECVLFVDDDPQNTEDVRVHCEGVAVHHVTAANGMGEADVAAVIRWAEKTCRKN